MDDLLPLARTALANNQLDKAIQLLLTATAQQPESSDVWFTLATALVRKGGQQAMCCIAYLRTLQLLWADDEAAAQTPQNVAVAAVAADNCWLLSEKLLPTAWPAALQDSAMHNSMTQGLLHHLQTLLQPQPPPSQQPAAAAAAEHSSNSSETTQQQHQHVQLLCVGGMGVQAMHLAAAASEAQGRAVQAAAEEAASSSSTTSNSSGSSSSSAMVPSMGLTFIPDGQLTAHLASQLLLDNDLDDIIDVCTWGEVTQQQREQQQQGQQQQQQAAAGVLALLAGAVQPNWGPALTTCVKTCHRLAALLTSSNSNNKNSSRSSSSSSPQCLLSPGFVRVWAVPVSCKELLELNEVDLQAIAEHTAGRYNYAAANARLRRSSRVAQVSRFNPTLLAEPAVVLEVCLQQLLQQLLQRYQTPQQRQQGAAGGSSSGSSAGAAPPAAAEVTAAALAAGRTAESSTVVSVQRAGEVDCVVWWLEYQWAPGYSTAYTPPAAAATAAYGHSNVVNGAACEGSTSSTSSSIPDVLQPHVWQHVQYLALPTGNDLGQQQQQQQQQRGVVVTQGQRVEAGQELLLRVKATAEDLQLAVSLAGGAPAAAGGSGANSKQQKTTQNQQQKQQQGSSVPEPGRDILPYHLSMLNDHARTEAYDKGIAGAVQQVLQQQLQQDLQQQASLQGQEEGCASGGSQAVSLQQQQQQGSGVVAPVVLDVGCGTGLLSMMAATAGAAAGGKLCVVGCEREPVLAQTALQLVADNSLQQDVSVVQKLSSKLTLPQAPAATTAAGAKKQQQQQRRQADLPAKAALVVHEIFGTDPLSEQVLPALHQVQQQLAAPGALFLPSSVRVVAAVAVCPAVLEHLCMKPNLSPKQHQHQHQPHPSTSDAAGAAAGGAAAGAKELPFELPAWDVSSLLPLQPRKLELQLDDLQDQLLLLTVPQPVLTFDFQQPIQLRGKQRVQLPALQEPLPLQQWMQQQQQQQQQQCDKPQGSSDAIAACVEPIGDTTTSGSGAAGPSGAAGGGSTAGVSSSLSQVDRSAGLMVMSWFEANCGEGGLLSTRPGATRLGHWQQSVEFVGTAAAGGKALTRSPEAAAADDGSSNAGSDAAKAIALQVSWNNDRVTFALAN